MNRVVSSKQTKVSRDGAPGNGEWRGGGARELVAEECKC